MRCQRRRSLDWLSLSFLFSRCLLLFNNLLKKLVTHNSFHPSIQSQIFLYMYCFFIFDHFQRLRWVLAFTQSPLWRASSVLLFWRVFFFLLSPHLSSFCCSPGLLVSGWELSLCWAQVLVCSSSLSLPLPPLFFLFLCLEVHCEAVHPEQEPHQHWTLFRVHISVFLIGSIPPIRFVFYTSEQDTC